MPLTSTVALAAAGFAFGGSADSFAKLAHGKCPQTAAGRC